MKKYSVVNERSSPPRVVSTYPFQWMAELMARVYGGEDNGYGVAILPTDAQTILTICVQREQAFAELELVRASPVIGILWSLISRDEHGKWTTVHEADTPLMEQDQEALHIIFAGQ